MNRTTQPHCNLHSVAVHATQVTAELEQLNISAAAIAAVFSVIRVSNVQDLGPLLGGESEVRSIVRLEIPLENQEIETHSV